MASNSQANQIEAKPPEELISQIRELFGRTAYTHKVHEKCADIYNQRLQAFKITQIVLSALTTGSLILAIFGEGKTGVILGAVFSTILFGINMYLKDYDLGELIQKHVNTASRLWDVRESYLSILTDLLTNRISVENACTSRDELQEKLASIYYNPPRTTPKAYSLAQKALKVDEDMTFSEEELNSLLPEALRIESGQED